MPVPGRLPKELAARILDRAASLDAAEDRVDVKTLRAAALDAGISPEAFERALAEAAASIREPVRMSRAPVDAYGVAVSTFWVGLLSGGLTILAAMAVFGPDEDALAGAAIGAGGALVGVFVHLLRTFRNRNR